MNKTLFFPLLTATLLASCSSDNIEAPEQDQRLLSVEVTENPLLDSTNGEPKMLPTRSAAATTTETLNEFYMNYQESQYHFQKYSNGTWSTQSWPSGLTPDTKINFYAYNYDEDSFYWNSGDPYISFTMSATDGFNQTDLLVATHKNISYNDAGGKVSLTFDHACAAVKFYICKTSGVGEKNVVVNSVVLSGVKYQGDYHYNTSSWESLSGTASYTLTNSPITLDTQKVSLPCGYLFLIPQSKQGLTLTVTYSVNGGTAQSYDFNLNGLWEAGKEYPVNINMGTSIIN